MSEQFYEGRQVYKEKLSAEEMKSSFSLLKALFCCDIIIPSHWQDSKEKISENPSLAFPLWTLPHHAQFGTESQANIIFH